MKFAVVAAIVTVLAVTGCSDSADPDPIATTQASAPAPVAESASPSPTPLEPADVFVDVDNSQAEGDFIGAAQDASSAACGATGSDWVGSGTVTNPTEGPVNYRVWVAFTNAEGDTVGLVQANVDGVEPGASGEYSAAMPYSDDGALSCVLRVERRVAG